MFGVPIEWMNAHCVPVCSANVFTEMFGWSDSVLFGPRADNNDSVAPSQGVMFLRARRSRNGAHSWFRLKFTHATVLTLTIRHCCRTFRVGACSHSVRKVCVCRSMHAKCGCQGSVTCFGILFLTYGYMTFRVSRGSVGSCILSSRCVCCV